MEATAVDSRVKVKDIDSTYYHDEHHGVRSDLQAGFPSHDIESCDMKESISDSPTLNVPEEGDYVVTAKTWAVVVVCHSIYVSTFS